MNRQRRNLLYGMGAALAALSLRPLGLAVGRFEIRMAGTARGERVWFEPVGLAVLAGAVVEFVNRDRVNSHTATAYHADLHGKPTRMPDAVAPWDSGYLLPDDRFRVALDVPGEYDYYCLPHESGGMLGRIVVGQPGRDFEFSGYRSDANGRFGDLPTVADIIDAGAVSVWSE